MCTEVCVISSSLCRIQPNLGQLKNFTQKHLITKGTSNRKTGRQWHSWNAVNCLPTTNYEHSFSICLLGPTNPTLPQTEFITTSQVMNNPHQKDNGTISNQCISSLPSCVHCLCGFMHSWRDKCLYHKGLLLHACTHTWVHFMGCSRSISCSLLNKS